MLIMIHKTLPTVPARGKKRLCGWKNGFEMFSTAKRGNRVGFFGVVHRVDGQSMNGLPLTCSGYAEDKG